MGMIIGSVEKIIGTILIADTAEQASHGYPPVEIL
jgi:hypothetical protein